MIDAPHHYTGHPHLIIILITNIDILPALKDGDSYSIQTGA